MKDLYVEVRGPEAAWGPGVLGKGACAGLPAALKRERQHLQIVEGRSALSLGMLQLSALKTAASVHPT